MQIVQFLKELHDKALQYTPSLVFDKKHALHFTLVSLYGSLIELTGCMLTLLENRGKIGIPSIFRTFLETYVEFHNLSRDPKYGYHMEASDLKEWLRVLKAAAESDNPYLADVATLPNLPAIIQQKESQLQELKSKGYKPLTIFERFDRANMVEEYRSIYNFLSSDCHSNRRALVNRHSELGDGDFTLVFYKNAPDEMLHHLDSAAGLMVSATVGIHEQLESVVVPEVRLLRRRLDEVRSTYEELE